MTLKLNTLRAILKCASTDKFREVLLSVGIGPTCVAATNTHILAWVGNLCESLQSTSDVGNLVKREMIGKTPKLVQSATVDADSFEKGAGIYPNAFRIVPTDGGEWVLV